MVLTREQAEARVQELLAQAKSIMDEVTGISREHGLEPSFMEMTFHHRRVRWGESYRLVNPTWYSDEHWDSSSAVCMVPYSYGDEDEEP